MKWLTGSSMDDIGTLKALPRSNFDAHIYLIKEMLLYCVTLTNLYGGYNDTFRQQILQETFYRNV